MFKPVSPKLDVAAMEADVLKFWKKQEIFKKTTAANEGGEEYVFYEGPPTANGKPGVHHVLARAFKDMFPRYKIMRGYHVSRRGGWDTHGLPVEVEVEKKLGFTNKQQIEDYGIDKFNELCRNSVFTYIQDWERLTDRIAFWVDLKTAYVTFTDDYIESVWWILKNFWEKDLLYQGYKVVPYCPRCGTPLSDHEVNQGYKDICEESVFVRMPLADEEGTSLLVWTTTPWTLPGNVAVAAAPDVEYVKVEREIGLNGSKTKERLILARALMEKVFGEEEVKVIDSFKGKKLQGVKYNPLFTFMPPDKPAHYVVLGDFVTTEDGSGLVHMAPAFGADDMDMAMEFDLPVIQPVAPDGTFFPEVRPWSGVFVKDADPMIIADLEQRGLMFKVQDYEHSYPFCWRCKTPLLYYARETWYIRTKSLKDRLVALNDEINWVPAHTKKGRFGNWLENNIDWALGRERYWGTPLPVWECEGCHHQHAIGSRAELSELSGSDYSDLDLHRPYVDDVHFACQECGGKMNRVPELIDVWFDSGAMPYAQWHYPFENKEEFKKQYPADYICEAVDQTRGWFYSLHAISTLLNDQVSFKNVLSLGHILDGEGKKMSKTLGNIVDPWEVLDNHGADAFRWYLYTATPPGQPRRFSADLVSEVVRSFTLTLWNVYSFFVTYANLDAPTLVKPAKLDNLLDRWLLSSLNTLVRDVTDAYENYDVPAATRPISEFVDSLSTWYLRLSRRRFWRSEADADKEAAYYTLYTALTTLAKLLAPAMPFVADELYQNLIRSSDENAPESVHLSNWAELDESLIDENLNNEMAVVMKLVSLGHAARQKAELKVRQPLAEVAFFVGNVDERAAIENYAELIKGELNVKAVRLLDASSEAVSYSVKPYPKQLGQKYQNKFPGVRKAILAADAEDAARSLLSGSPFKVEFEGETLDILPEEVEVQAEAKAGYAVASDAAYLAALVTELTPELLAEGMAREFVRRVQDMRKAAEFDVSDRINIFVEASDDLQNAVDVHRDYIMGETLSTELGFADAPAGATLGVEIFGNEEVKIWILKV
ncbi:MAG: isoleucine--tRNA ligase [Anaerolineae bacterium]|jgi:isoleucyl-tRNA synthetase|nr:isoleucine--tRNA ligase [Anaerolineae bacterium]MBT7071209.1 isoleucine--tRNA ligase [Anaerolineae bacterium]MBT7324121.1 isoleucine--tRNA ligase [Anaerolineae bacterium]